MELEEYIKMYELEDRHWWFLGKRRIVRTLLARYVKLAPDDLILDVGCGTGGMMSVLQQFGETFGLDISSMGLELACERGFDTLTQASVQSLPFTDNTFGLVTSFDVLYHEAVGDDLSALKEFYRICRPGGYLLITDSALPILKSPHDRAYHAKRRYTTCSLGAKVVQAGFRILKLSYASSLLFPFILAVRLWKRYVHTNGAPSSDLWAAPPIFNSALYAVYGLEASLLPYCSLPVGSSVVCVARKDPPASSGTET